MSLTLRSSKMILIFFLLILLLYIYSTRNYRYWYKRNIKYETPLPFFGNHLKTFLGIKNITTVSGKLYNKYPEEKVIGYFRGPTPELIIRDPDIIRDILNVDFSYFYPRGLCRNVKKEKLLLNIFHVDGDTWKLLRKRLTPAFTTAKLKNMFPLIVKCAENLEGVGEEIVSLGGECEVRELMARFTTEFIAVCGFGIEVDALNNENCLIRKLGKKVFSRTFKELLLLGLWDIFPEFRSVLNASDKKLENGISHLVTEMFKERNFKSIGRNDFIDLILDLSAKGKIEGESVEHRHENGSPKRAEMEMNLDCLVAQVFVFFAAGFETSSSATSYTLHELAFKPDLQRRIQTEIDQVLLKYDNKLCYDAIAEMNLLNLTLKESMRKMPPVGNLSRICARKYTISKLGITIDPGVRITIPVQALHVDEKYYNNPNEFIPERFTPEEVNKRAKYVYLPFGDGPRACIGM